MILECSGHPGATYDGIAALAFVASGTADLDRLVTGHVPLDDAQTALTMTRTDPHAVTTIVCPGEAVMTGPGIDGLRDQGVEVRRVLLIGGAAASPAVRAVAATLFGVPVSVPEPGEYLAVGAARQAAWALAGSDAPPAWPVPTAASLPVRDADAGRAVIERYEALRHALHG